MTQRLVLSAACVAGIATLAIVAHANQAIPRVNDIVKDVRKNVDRETGAAPASSSGAGDFVLNPGETHDCAATQSCKVKCPKGKCNVRCGASSTCAIDCQGPGCEVDCGGSAKCTVKCPKGGCTTRCGGSAECSVDCPKGNCGGMCGGAADCSLSCPKLVKKKKTCGWMCGGTADCGCKGAGCKGRKK